MTNPFVQHSCPKMKIHQVISNDHEIQSKTEKVVNRASLRPFPSDAQLSESVNTLSYHKTTP